MQLSSIDFGSLTKVEYRSVQVERLTAATGEAPRLIFRDDTRFYKVWPTSNPDPRTVFWNGHRRLVRNRNKLGEQVLPGFLYGLYDETVCAAFDGYIYDGVDLVGYTTRTGRALEMLDLEDPSHDAFVARMVELTLRSGVAYRDLKGRNIVALSDGRLSLIDLEPPPVLLNGYAVAQETKNGSLARWTDPRYRQFIHAYLDPANSDARLVAARRRFATGLPDAFQLAIDDRAPARAKG